MSLFCYGSFCSFRVLVSFLVSMPDRLDRLLLMVLVVVVVLPSWHSFPFCHSWLYHSSFCRHSWVLFCHSWLYPSCRHSFLFYHSWLYHSWVPCRHSFLFCHSWLSRSSFCRHSFSFCLLLPSLFSRSFSCFVSRELILRPC